MVAFGDGDAAKRSGDARDDLDGVFFDDCEETGEDLRSLLFVSFLGVAFESLLAL